MKTVHVAAGVIRKDNRIFATQRGYGEFKDKWEFPGGKMEAGETAEEALKREIKEELNTEIKVEDFIGTIEMDYPQFHLIMECYWAEVEKGHLDLLEHEAARWISTEKVDQLDWLPADRALIEKIRR